MTVESRFSDYKAYPSPKFQRNPLDVVAEFIETCRLLPCARADSRWSPEFTKLRAQSVAPFPSCHAGLGRLNRGWHDIRAARSRCTQGAERILHARLVPRFPPCLEAHDLIALCFLGRHKDRILSRR